MMLENGTLGHYKILEKIGEGGMAEVYKAYEPGVDRHVAVKVMLPNLARDADFRARFDREARSIARLEHLHILPIYAYGEQDGQLYLAMRFLSGGSLEDMIGNEGPIPLDEIARLITESALALDYAHEHGVLHRDVKPENVLLDNNRNAFLSDFGLAKMVEMSSTLTGNLLPGTPAYMSPETALGEDVGPAADQYSLAVLLYQMVTGRIPFDHDNPMKVIQMHIRKEPINPQELRYNLPEAAEVVMMRGLAKYPKERFSNCKALADAFYDAVTSKGLRISGSNRLPRALRNRIDDALGSLDMDDTPKNPKKPKKNDKK